MDLPPPLPAHRSQRISPQKPRLNPPYALFPDALHAPYSPTRPPPPPSSPSPVRDNDEAYDYFNWLSHEATVTDGAHSAPTDLTTCAPSGALPDLHCSSAEVSAPRSHCYAVCKGLQSSVGAFVFAHNSVPTRSPTRRRSRRAAHATCACLVSPRSMPLGTPYPILNEPDSDRYSVSSYSSESDEDEFVREDDSKRRLFSGKPAISYPCERLPTPLPPKDHSEGDITAEEAASGVDVQGIPWERLQLTREDYRATRLRENPRRDSTETPEGLRDLVKEPKRDARFYDFFKNTRKVKCNIVHFQLRNLAWATSKHDVFVMHDGVIVHWDACAKRKSKVLDLSGSTASGPNSLGILVQISTMIAKGDLVIAGGFYGEMVAKNLRSGTIIHNKRITYDENAITNAIDIYDDTIITSNNDRFVRTFDINTFKRKSAFRFQQPVNHATRRPFGKMVAVAGDDKPIQVIDGDTGERITQLHGHEDYSFATGWHPSGRLLATGSQDQTCRVWDVRNMSQSISVLGARLGAVRSLRFSSCGQFLFMAEPRDYVHIFDVNRGEFDTCQEIDLFGEIAGIALTPCSEGLYIAVSDRTYSSLLEYERRNTSLVNDLLL
ncbi:putative WD repeat-containing protein [Gracilariopsis chorda]|uniref:Putative WD repeat-containing protein n=1 Tax=Gracilariopsis chorda TaxID=448386 RepID=A0A2V3J7T4_9FLOR|nr:putative WD repeat-containing protein [Gracilariopsis chorda]|eukprot:PXF49937.1 putative WD repeat-containing protein [Gracilariopsis chorda]